MTPENVAAILDSLKEVGNVENSLINVPALLELRRRSLNAS